MSFPTPPFNSPAPSEDPLGAVNALMNRASRRGRVPGRGASGWCCWETKRLSSAVTWKAPRRSHLCHFGKKALKR